MTAKLARSITWKSSKQTYLTALALVDSGMEDDCYRAYSYFRWADDVIDQHCQSPGERIDFIERQIRLVNGLCKNESFEDLSPEVVTDTLNVICKYRGDVEQVKAKIEKLMN